MALNSKLFLTIDAGIKKLATAIGVSAGAGDADKIIHTNAQGNIDPTFLPPGIELAVITAEASETLAAGDFVNIYESAGTKVRKADGSDPLKYCNGYVLDAIPISTSGSVYLMGENNQLAGLTTGLKYWLSTSAPGAATSTPPANTDGNIIQILGFASAATAIRFEFNPYVEIDIA